MYGLFSVRLGAYVICMSTQFGFDLLSRPALHMAKLSSNAKNNFTQGSLRKILA